MSLHSPWQGILTFLSLFLYAAEGRIASTLRIWEKEEVTRKKESPLSAKSIICFISMSFAVFTENSSHAGSHPSDMMHVL